MGTFKKEYCNAYFKRIWEGIGSYAILGCSENNHFGLQYLVA